jgi:hypothetical protein
MLESLEQACARMTPYLTVVAVGLALLNLIWLVAMSPYLRVTRISYENVGAATQSDCKTTLGMGGWPTSEY